MDEWLYNVVNGRPWNWKRPCKILLGCLLYFLLIAAAIYELVKW